MPGIGDDEEKNKVNEIAFEKAVANWLDARFAEFGKWSAKMIITMIILVTFYGWLKVNGWLK